MAIKSLKLSVFFVVLFEVLPTVGEFWYVVRSARVEAAESASHEAIRFVRLVSHDFDKVLIEARQFLTVLGEVPEVRRASTHPESCGDFVENIRKQNSTYANLGVINPQGLMICSSIQFPEGLDLSDRLYFRKAMETKSFAIGEYQIGRVTKKATLNVARAILDENQKLLGVVFAALDLSQLRKLVSDAGLSSEAIFLVLDHKGRIMVRYPHRQELVGKMISEAPVLKAILSQSEGRVVGSTGNDGVARMYSFQKLQAAVEAGDVFVVIGVPEVLYSSQIQKILWGRIGREVIWTLIQISLAWGAGLLFLYQIKKIQKVAKKLSAGDLSARTDLKNAYGELERLARTFDLLASKLEARQREAQVEIQRLAFLTESAALLKTPETFQALTSTLQRICHQAVPGFADYCCMDLSDSKGQFKRLAAEHFSLEKTQILKETNFAVGYGLSLDQAQLLPRRPGDDALGSQALIWMPVVVHGHRLGTLIFGMSESGRSFSDEDFAIAEDLADFVGFAAEFVKLKAVC